MKLKVLRRFRDKNTKELYEVGSVIEVEDERGEELLSHEAKLVSEVKAKKAPKKKKGSED